MTSPTGLANVMLDAGGLFVLPDPSRVLGAFGGAECTAIAGSPACLDRRVGP